MLRNKVNGLPVLASAAGGAEAGQKAGGCSRRRKGVWAARQVHPLRGDQREGQAVVVVAGVAPLNALGPEGAPPTDDQRTAGVDEARVPALLLTRLQFGVASMLAPQGGLVAGPPVGQAARPV